MDILIGPKPFPCQITRYLDDTEQRESTEQINLCLGKHTSPTDPDQIEYWLLFQYGPQSMPVTAESIRRSSAEGWCAQAGTRPVRIDGVLGGNNYPQMMFTAETMTAVWNWMAVKCLEALGMSN